MFSRCTATLSAAPILAIAFALSGCGDSTPAAGTQTTSTAPAAVAAPPSMARLPGAATSSTPAVAPATVAAPTPQIYEINVKLDPVKYPQDTPEKAFESIAKSIEGNDLAYQIAWLSVPIITKNMLDKYKTLDAAVAANQTEKSIAGRKVMLKTIRDMQAAKSTSEGEDNGVKWFRFALDEKTFIQLEKQRDGRWCMNPAVRAK